MPPTPGPVPSGGAPPVQLGAVHVEAVGQRATLDVGEQCEHTCPPREIDRLRQAGPLHQVNECLPALLPGPSGDAVEPQQQLLGLPLVVDRGPRPR
jgi:hypothetical protein